MPQKLTLLLVDDDPRILKAYKKSLEAKGDFAVTTSTVPVDPTGFHGAILDWQPHGADMAGLCDKAWVPYVVFTGAPSLVPSGVPVATKPASAEHLLNALIAVTSGEGSAA